MSYELQIASLKHTKFLSKDDVESLRQECEDNRDNLNQEVEDLEDEKSDIENDLDELEAGSSAHEMATARIEAIEKEIAEKREESDKWNDDESHLADALISADTDFICYSEIDDYIRDTFDECNEIPSYLQNYIDWESLVKDIKMDYSCVDIDGREYWYR